MWIRFGDMNIDTNGVHLATGHNGSQFNQVVGGIFMIPNAGNPLGPQLRVPFHGDLERQHDTVREERSELLHQDGTDVGLHRASAALYSLVKSFERAKSTSMLLIYIYHLVQMEL